MAGHYESKAIPGTEDPITGFPKFQDVWVEDAKTVSPTTQPTASASPIIEQKNQATNPAYGSSGTGVVNQTGQVVNNNVGNNNVSNPYISTEKTKENTLLAYDTKNNYAPVYVKPGVYIPGISATPSSKTTLDNYMDKTTNDVINSNEITPSNIPTITETTTGQYSLDYNNGINSKLSTLNSEQFNTIIDKQSDTISELNTRLKQYDEKLSQINDEVAASKLNTEKMQTAWEKADVEGKLVTQSSLVNSINNLVTTVYKDTPSGAVPMQTISDQNYGTFAGLYSALQASQGYTKSATDTITSYYGEKANQIKNRITSLQNVANTLSTRANVLSEEDLALTQARIDVLKAEQEQINKKQNLLDTAVTENPEAFAISGIDLDKDDYNTILQKLGNAKSRISVFNSIMENYQDAGINTGMSIAQMADILENSPLYKAKLASQGEMSDAQVYKRAVAKQQEYINAGKYISYEDAEKIVKGGIEVSKNYGKPMYNELQSQLASNLTKIKDDSQKLTYVQTFDNFISQGDVEAAVGVINDLAYFTSTPENKKIVDVSKDNIKLLTDAINKVSAYKDTVSIGIFNTIENKVLGKINADKDPEAAYVKATINDSVLEIRKEILGSNISMAEIGISDASFPNMQDDTVRDALIKLNALNSAIQVKLSNRYESMGGVDYNDNIGTVISKYQANDSNAKAIDAIYAENPNAAPAEVLQALQSLIPSSVTENGSGNGGDTALNQSAARYTANYINSSWVNSTDSDEAVNNLKRAHAQGTIGGWCGDFARSITNRMYAIGDSLEEKQASVRSKGYTIQADGKILDNTTNKSMTWYPQTGQTIIFNTNPTTDKDGNTTNYGHVAVVTGYNPITNKITIVESNYHNDKKVTYDREITLNKNDANYNKIYGILPTKLSASFTYTK